MSVISLMNAVVNIETETQTKNSSGLGTRSWAVRSSPSGTALPARIDDLDDNTILEYARLGYEATNVIYFASDPSLAGHEATSRIVWRNSAYYITKIQNSGGQINKLWRAVAVGKPLAYSTTG